MSDFKLLTFIINLLNFFTLPVASIKRAVPSKLTLLTFKFTFAAPITSAQPSLKSKASGDPEAFFSPY